MALTRALFTALAAHAPIVGVSIGNPDDRATWRIDFADDATPEERAAAEAALLAFAAPPAPPITVTPWQAREALRLDGRLADVDAFIDALGPQHQAYIAYHYAERFSRASPLIAALKAQLGMTDEDLDALFAVAKGLTL